MVEATASPNENMTVEKVLFKHVEWSGFVLLLSILSLVNLLLLAFPLPGNARSVVIVVNIGIGFIFWTDFFFLLRQVSSKRHFLWDDGGWVLLIGNLPSFSIVRLLWFRWVLKTDGRKFRDIVSQIGFNHNASATVLLVFFTVIVVFELSVVLVLYFEEPTIGSNIKSVSDGFWWAFVTIATVGYGDRYPITIGGRIVAVMLMIVGIAMFSVITSSLAGWFRSRPIRSHLEAREARNTEHTGDIAEIKELLNTQQSYFRALIDAHEATYRQKVDELHSRIATLEASGGRSKVKTSTIQDDPPNVS